DGRLEGFGENLAGVEPAIGVETGFEIGHRLQIILVVELAQIILLLGADAVLAGHGAPGGNAGHEDFVGGLVSPMAGVLIPPVKKNGGVNVAVAGVEKVANRQI